MHLKNLLAAAVCGSLLSTSGAWADTVSTPLAAYTTPSISELGISADGSRLAAYHYDLTKVTVWDAAGGAQIREIVLEFPYTEARTAAFSPDGSTVALAVNQRLIVLWSLVTGAELRSITHDSEIGTLAFSADGRTLASGDSFATRVALWDTASGTKLREWNEAEGVGELAFSPDGRTVAVITGSNAVLRNTADGSVARTLNKPDYFFSNLAFSPDGKTLALSASSFAPAYELQLWDVATGTLLRSMNTGYTTLSDDLMFSPDGRLLAHAGGGNRNFKLWDTTTATEVRTHTDTMQVTDAVFSPDGSRVYSAVSGFSFNNPGIRVWEVPGATVASQCATYNPAQAPQVTVPCLQIGTTVYSVALNLVSSPNGPRFEADLSRLKTVSLTPGADCAMYPYENQNVLRLNCVDVGGIKYNANLGLVPHPAAIQFELTGAAAK